MKMNAQNMIDIYEEFEAESVSFWADEQATVGVSIGDVCTARSARGARR